jgi:inorganic pyrophosphatase
MEVIGWVSYRPDDDPQHHGPPHVPDREIENIFRTYKEVEDKLTQLVRWQGVDAAMQVIAHARNLFKARSYQVRSLFHAAR